MRVFIVFVMAITVGGVFAYATYNYVQNAPTKTVTMPTQKVVVAASDLDIGAEIQQEEVLLLISGMADLEGEPTRAAPFDLDGEEYDFYDALTRYVEDQSIKAAQEDSPRSRALTFTMAMLQRRFASSVYAVRRSLERMRDKRKKIHELLTAGVKKADLRLLQENGYVEVVGADGQLRGAGLDSARVRLTPAGSALAGQLMAPFSKKRKRKSGFPDFNLPATPTFHRETGLFTWGGIVIDLFRRPAPNLELLLNALVKHEWPPWTRIRSTGPSSTTHGTCCGRPARTGIIRAWESSFTCTATVRVRDSFGRGRCRSFSWRIVASNSCQIISDFAP